MKIFPATPDFSVGGAETALLVWFKAVGLSPQPFSTLEASADPHLVNYSIDHYSFPVAWGDWHSFIFASAGGGKTALRANVVQSCWIGHETNRPFPISYIPAYLSWGHIVPTLDEHLSAIVQAGAMQLLLSLSHHPHWFMRLTGSEQEKIRIILDLNLPGPLRAFIQPCRESLSLEPLRNRFSPALVPRDQPEPTAFLPFFDLLDSIQPSALPNLPVLGRWVEFQDALLDILGFPAIYILLDSFDATQETATVPQTIVYFFAPFLPHLRNWAGRKTFLKSFLPLETQPALMAQYPSIFELSQSVSLQWTADLLSEMIRRRIFFSSEGNYGSLAPISAPDLREPELILAKEIIPLPREMLLLTKQVMISAAMRGGKNPKISHQDIEMGIQRYRQGYFPPGNLM